MTASHFVVDDDAAYVDGGTLRNGTGVVRVPVDGGATSMLLVTETNALAMDQSSIYFTSGGIERIDKDGGAPQPVTTAVAEAIALDDAFVYWRSDHAILRVPKLGGTEQTIVATNDLVVSFVVDDVNVYGSEFPLVDASLSLAHVLRVSKTGGSLDRVPSFDSTRAPGPRARSRPAMIASPPNRSPPVHPVFSGRESSTWRRPAPTVAQATPASRTSAPSRFRDVRAASSSRRRDRRCPGRRCGCS